MLDCKEEKSIHKFPKDSSRSDGVKHVCKNCIKLRKKLIEGYKEIDYNTKGKEKQCCK